MPYQPAETVSRQQIAARVLRRLGITGNAADPSADDAARIVEGYEALYQEIDWRGTAPFPIDLTPARISNGLVTILCARYRPDFKGGVFDQGEENQGWRLFNAANYTPASWAPVQATYI
jgi:hypothetical protein